MVKMISHEDLQALRDGSFRRVFAARSISVLGNAIAPVALAFAVLDMPGGSASTLGLVLVVRQLAQIIFLLLGGVIADRFPRNRVMVSSDVLSFLTQGAVAAVFIDHTARLLPLLALSAVSGAAPALFIPASMGLVRQIVPQKRLQSANALLRTTMNSMTILGAAVAGGLVVTIGPGWGLAVDAASFLISAVLLFGMRIPHAERLPKASMISDLRTGWREFASRQWVWVIVLQFSLSNACYNGGINVLGPLVAKQHLGGALAWSAFAAARAVGLLAGSVVALRVRPRYPMRAATLATFGFVPAFFMLAVAAPVWALAASGFLIGVCVDIFTVLWETGLQTHIPKTAISRVGAYDSLGSVAAVPLGMAAAGPAAATFGETATLVVGGLITMLVNTCALLSPQVRKLPATLPEPASQPVQPEPALES